MSDIQIVIKLYEGCIRFLNEAIKRIETGDDENKSACIAKARDVITELDNMINIEEGGEIARNLRSIYKFINDSLDKNGKEEKQNIKGIISLLEELNSAWKAISL